MKFARTIILAAWVLMCMRGGILAQSISGSIASPAAIQYGSIGSSADPQGSFALGLQSSAGDYPIRVAQNSSPATIAPISPAAPPLTPPPAAGSSPLLLQPIDPYAAPAPSSFFGGTPVGSSTASNSVLANSSASNPYTGSFDKFVPETYEAMRRFRDATSFEFTYLPGGNEPKSFGLGELDMRLQLAVPCRFIPNNGANAAGTGFFYIAPGGSLVWWDGPVGPPDMSPNGFGAFFDFGVQPQFNSTFGLNAWGRFGLFSDFNKVTSDAFRFQGRLEGVVNLSPQMQVLAGIIYLGRERVKILPTGGVIWTPRDDLIIKAVFPNPKISKRLWNGQRAEWWGYLQGDYAGGSWDIKGLGRTDYNDIRIGAGIEFATQSRIGGYFEFGGSFARELYSDGHRWAKPPEVLYLKTGIIF